MMTITRKNTAFSISWILPLLVLFVPMFAMAYLGGLGFTRGALNDGLAQIHDLTETETAALHASLEGSSSGELCLNETVDC